MANFKDKAIKEIIANLSKEGKRLVDEALRTKATGNRSYNQADAFGYVVYYNKVAKASGYANPTPVAEKPHHGNSSLGIPTAKGRDWLDEWMRIYTPSENGFVLVIVNAAFYSLFQEAGTAHGKYRIITQVYSGLESVAAKNGGYAKIFVSRV